MSKLMDQDLFNTLHTISTESEMLALAATFSSDLRMGHTIYLNGDLGAGKTVFIRGVLQALGVVDAITSPTFSLVESYQSNGVAFHHFDLYRLEDEYELELMGVREYFNSQSIVAIEWPEKALMTIAPADYEVNITIDKDTRKVAIKKHEI